jgi:hypothetical protein
MTKVSQISNVDLVVYAVVSPERGQSYMVYTEEDIQALGGVHTIERSLENESYWFVRLGAIAGEADPRGVSITDAEFSKVAVSPPSQAWQIGRQNPGFSRPEFDRRVFRAIFEAVERLLRTWNCEIDGTVHAYALKELRISSECLVSLTNGLRNLPQVHEIVHITVIKYWYDPSWPKPHTLDLVLAEFSLDIPFRVQWSAGEEIVDVHVLPLFLC